MAAIRGLAESGAGAVFLQGVAGAAADRKAWGDRAAGGGRLGSQPYLGARAHRSEPGHMMMDWVSPRLRGDAAAHSLEAVRLRPALRDRAGLTGEWLELAAVVRPHLDDDGARPA